MLYCVEKGLEPLPLDDETNEQPFALLYKVVTEFASKNGTS